MKLKTYLEEQGISTYSFAKMCGVAQSVAYRWASEETRPDWSNIPAIQKATNNKVTAMDFVPEDVE